MRRVLDSSTRGMLRDRLNIPPEKALKFLYVYRNKPVIEETHESEGFIRKGKDTAMPGDLVDGNVITTFTEQAPLVLDLLEYRACVRTLAHARWAAS
ncbi:hypothetical protein MRX96_001915 [Rhipicephalus microplus]